MKDESLEAPPPDLFLEVVKGIDGEDSGKPVFTAYTFLPLKYLAFQYVQAVLVEAGYNKTLAAKMLGVDRRTLYRILTRGSVGNVSKY